MRVASAGEAARDIVAVVPVQPPLRIPLIDSVGHVLAEDLTASIDLPPWTNAAMDGYAVRATDIRGARRDAPMHLRVIGAIPAGAVPDRALRTGEAMRIYTGAPLPADADSVIRQEDTDRGAEYVTVFDDRDAGANVRRVGGDLARGALALPSGTVIGPHQLALLAALAVTHPMVHRRPRVGILATGDEVVSLDHPEEILASRRLADVNSPALAALVQQAGGVAVPLGLSPDDPAELQRVVLAADDVDLLITAGGVSVGDHDHVRSVMAACGVTTSFDRVRIRPGGPTTFGRFPPGRPWLALPGNPVSAMVTFELFGRPAVRAMSGHRDPFRPVTQVVLADDAHRDPVLDQYLRCTFDAPEDGRMARATLTGPQGSGMLMSMARADGLVLVPAGKGAALAGSMARAWFFT